MRDHHARRICLGGLALLAAAVLPACSEDDSGSGGCTDESCAARCRTLGSTGGRCSAGNCLCDGAGDADADGGADADADVDADVVSEGDGTCIENIDIVFVLDVSTSMTPILQALHDGIGDVWAYARGIDPEAQFGLVVFVDDVLVTNGGNWYATVDDIQNEFDAWRDFCSSNGEPGGDPGMNDDCPENSLDAIWAGATSFPWRDNALHVIFHATDDTFAENPGTLGTSWIEVQHNYPEVLAELRTREIRLAAFAAHDSSDCAIPPVHNTEPGFFAEWGGDPALPTGTGAQVFDIQEVMSHTLSMTEAINDVILDEYCTPFIY
ncbi:MAG: hypothetical protein HY905_13540 [Deltaproteobacteria bacterium]|nr:hypothetical protein [Deltaproteobacteria bacterium]